LSGVGGDAEVRAADPALERLLRASLQVDTSETRVQAHVHGFHSYPARLHPDTARAILDGASAATDSVLDPFCGSGTVVVEARALGRRAFGSDLNPIAVRLAALKSASVTDDFIEELLRGAQTVAAHALERKERKLGPSERYGAEDRALFAAHVLLELDGLRHGIEALPRGEVAETLKLVHSALLTKLSQRLGDSSQKERPKRIAAGFAIRFFGAKAEELARRLREFSALVPSGTPRARVEVADARRLAFVRDASIRLVVTSPPYPGVYDYYEHHRARLRWMRLPARRFAENELASRRSARLARGEERGAGWQRDFAHCLAEIQRVLATGGRAFVVIGDSVFGGRALYATEWLPDLAERAGLVPCGHAAQLRAHFHAATGRAFSEPRREHVFVFEKQSRRPR
jgi:SAM-dependent methyltransferase